MGWEDRSVEMRFNSQLMGRGTEKIQFRAAIGCLGIAGKCNIVLEHKKGAYFL